MKPERSSLGGFENPSEKWHSFEIGDDVAFMKRRDEDGNQLDELSDTISFPCVVIEDDEEKGRQCFVNCDLSKQGGRTSCARFLYFIKLAPILEKDFNMKEDLNEKEWGEKYLNPDNEKCQKVFDAIVTKAPGKSFDGEIKHNDYQGKTYANIRNLAMYGKGGAEGSKPSPKSESKKSAKSDDVDEF